MFYVQQAAKRCWGYAPPRKSLFAMVLYKYNYDYCRREYINKGDLCGIVTCKKLYLHAEQIIAI